MIIVIDGPAGSGKSSTARAVADKMGLQYLDSGALYRALTLIYLESGCDEERFFELVNEKSISFRYEAHLFRVYIDGEEVTRKLREMEVSENVSRVASMPESRRRVNELMRSVVSDNGYIAEGRDLGTAVFPDADLKFFMSADLETRTRRRFEELRLQGVETDLEEVRENIRRRDRKDSQRRADPLKKPDDAIEIDTTNLGFEQQVQLICSHIAELPKSKKT